MFIDHELLENEKKLEFYIDKLKILSSTINMQIRLMNEIELEF